MPKEIIELFGKSFPSKDAAKRHIQSILNRYPFGAPLSFDDDMDIWLLLRRHPEFDEKRGAGIHHFTVEKAFRGTKCFFIHREDGTSIDFSYLACLYGTSNEQDFRKACREAVFTDIMEFRRQNLVPGMRCSFTGEALTEANTHVDHAPPYYFEVIVRQFIADAGIDVSKISFPKGGGFATIFGDPALAQQFREYHNARAVLRLISKKANLSLTRRGA